MEPYLSRGSQHQTPLKIWLISLLSPAAYSYIATTPVSVVAWRAPRGRGMVSENGMSLLVTLEGEGRLLAGVLYTMFVPQRFLSPNLPWPQRSVLTTLGYIETAMLTVPLPFQVSLLDYLLFPWKHWFHGLTLFQSSP